MKLQRKSNGIPFNQRQSHKDVDVLWGDSCNMKQIGNCLSCNASLTESSNNRFCDQCYKTLRILNR